MSPIDNLASEYTFLDIALSDTLHHAATHADGRLASGRFRICTPVSLRDYSGPKVDRWDKLSY